MNALLLTVGVLGVASAAAAGGFTPPTVSPAPPALAITQQPEAVAAYSWNMVELHVEATGPGPVTYEWRHNGGAITNPYILGAQTATLLMAPAPPNAEGTYTVRVSSGGQTILSEPVEVDLGCYPDCNEDMVLNLADFGCFQTKFAVGDPYADCNSCGALNLADFGCFMTSFALGC